MSNAIILPWQHEHWTKLNSYYHAERLPHALLLAGPQGIGKTNFAICFAQRLLCEQPINGFGCGKCLACYRFLANSHPDFLWMRPANAKTDSTPVNNEETTDSSDNDELETANSRTKPKKGSRYIVVDQIRALSEWIGLKSHYHGLKIALIAPAEQMNINAANSLLKTLEEPPGASLIMLATSHPAQLTATLRSRCQTLTFPPVTIKDALPWFNQQGIINQESAALLLKLAEGGPLNALELFNNDTLKQRLTVFEELEKLITGKLAPVVVAQTWVNRDIELLINFQWTWIADMIILSFVPEAKIINFDLMPRLAVLARLLGLRRLYAQLDHLLETLRLIRGATNPNMQLLVEDLLIPWRA